MRKLPRGRKKNRRRKGWLRPLLAVLTLGLMAEVAAAVLTTPRLSLRRVYVRGARLLDESQVRSRAGLFPGQNVLLLDVRGAEARVRALPEVKGCSVYRKLPNAVVVDVTERQPVATLITGDGRYLVDREGVAYRKIEGSLPNRPKLKVASIKSLTLGKPTNGGLIPTGLRCLKQVSSVAPQALVSVDPYGLLCLNMGDLQVRLGSSERLAGKLSLLRGLLEAKPELRYAAEYLDLSSPESPAWKPRPQAAAAGSPDRESPSPGVSTLVAGRPASPPSLHGASSSRESHLDAVRPEAADEYHRNQQQSRDRSRSSVPDAPDHRPLRRAWGAPGTGAPDPAQDRG